MDTVKGFGGAEYGIRSCEVQTESGKECGRPALFQSLFTWHLTEKRHLFVCNECGEQLNEFMRNLPADDPV